MESYHDFYCRLCLSSYKNTTKGSELVEICINTRIHEQIITIFGFDPISMSRKSIKKDFSSLICYECRVRVDDIAEFIEDVQKNQQKLEKASLKEIVTITDDDLYLKQEDELMEVEYLDHEMDDVSVKEEPVIEDPIDEKPYICHLCSKSYRTKNLLTHHMNERHVSDGFPYKCKICDQPFNSKSDLKTHRQEMHVKDHENVSVSIDKYLICELCDPSPSFATFKDMTEHYQDTHDTRGYARCCQKQFFTRKSIVNHSDIHSNPTKYMCKICQKLLPDKYTLRDHTLRHNPDDERKFECDFCHKKFHVQKDLSDHINRLHRKKNKTEERVTCVECDKTFVSKCSFMTHNRRFHMDIERPICETCGKVCKSKADLSTHIKARHTDVPRQKCEVCGSYVKYLQKHMKIHIESQLNIKCDICGLQTTTYKYLRFHMKIHTEEKPFECNTCGTAFKRKNALEDHMSIHNGIPRHFCNYCDRTFNNSGNKSKHIKLVHPEEAASQRKRTQIESK